MAVTDIGSLVAAWAYSVWPFGIGGGDSADGQVKVLDQIGFDVLWVFTTLAGVPRHMGAERGTILISRPEVVIVIFDRVQNVSLVLKNTDTEIGCLTDIQDR